MRVGARSVARKVVVRARALLGSEGESLNVRWDIKVNQPITKTKAGSDFLRAGYIDYKRTFEQAMDASWKDYEFDLSLVDSGWIIIEETISVEIELSTPARRPSVDDRRELSVAVDSVTTKP